MSSYLLVYDGISRMMESKQAIMKGRVLMLLKPADDRSIKDGFRANLADLVKYKVVDTDDSFQELPAGGLDEIKILHLERFYDAPKPGEHPITLGG